MNHANVQLDVQLGRLHLANPITVASGTFGYAREMAGLVDRWAAWAESCPKPSPRSLAPAIPRRGPSRPPPECSIPSAWTTTASSVFVQRQLPYLAGLGTKIIVSIAGNTREEFVEMAARLDGLPGADALELNISCPNVSGGVDFGTDPAMCEAVVAGVRHACRLPVIAKLTPNVTSIATIARAAEAGGADAVSLINTCLGMAVDWRRRRAILGRGMGGLSGPAIKPIALRAVYQVAPAVRIPLMGIGGIATIDDVMEFLVAGATAVQIGTANFYRPTVSIEIARRPARCLGRARRRVGRRSGRTLAT